MRLELEDAAPYRLSRRHFAVVASDGGLAVRDDHSTLGTVVNGEAVGEQFPRSEAPLRRGENLVVAGGVRARSRSGSSSDDGCLGHHTGSGYSAPRRPPTRRPG